MSRASISAVVCSIALATTASSSLGDSTPAEVERAICGGVDFLRQSQGIDGSWGPSQNDLVILALLTAGTPVDDPAIVKGIDWSLKQEADPDKDGTYVVALQTMILAMVDPARHRDRIARNAAWLGQTQARREDVKGSAFDQGAWSYRLGLRPCDNSNTQYAILGLNAAAEAGVVVPDEVWRDARRHWEACQLRDGGWSYTAGFDQSSAGMTCAGIASLIITGREMRRQGEVLVGDSVHRCGIVHATPDPALERGIAWMGRRFSVAENVGQDFTQRGVREWKIYYLYGLERAGRLAGRRRFGSHDWYREGVEELLRIRVAGEGVVAWYGDGGPIVSTSFAILFLAKGRSPVLINKLVHGPHGDWDNDPDDARNLTELAARDWKQFLAWQVVDPADSTVEDLLQAPIAFLNGHSTPEFDDASRRRLREYVEQGGFLMAESCCGRPEFDRGVRLLIKDLFPEPEHELHPLPEDHPIWRMKFDLDPKDHPLWGVDFGCRTVLVYSPTDLSCYWNLSRSHPDHRSVIAANHVGLNLIAYATGGEPPADKLAAGGLARDKVGLPRRGALWIAKLRHDGDWNVAPFAVPNLTTSLRRKRGIDVVINHRSLLPGDPNLVNFPLLYLHGRGAFSFAPEDLASLRRHLKPGGGTIFADAACGSPAFDASFREFVAALLPGSRLEPIPPDDPINTIQVGYDLSDVESHEGPDRRRGPPRLEGIKVDGRWSVIYSRLDIGCALQGEQAASCVGYTHESALRIATNIVLHATLP